MIKVRGSDLRVSQSVLMSALVGGSVMLSGGLPLACSEGTATLGDDQTGRDAGLESDALDASAAGGAALGGATTGAGATSNAAGTSAQSSDAPVFAEVNDSCDIAKASGASPIIDDMEDEDFLLLDAEQRGGEWWWSGDDSQNSEHVFEIGATLPDRGQGRFALHSAGSGFVGWGEVMGFDLRPGVVEDEVYFACPYDAAVYEGIRFWGRGNGVALRVKATMNESVPVSYGGLCTLEIEDDCWNDHGAYVVLNDEWQEHFIAFEDLRQDPTWGVQIPFDASRIGALRFQTDPGVEYDYWIDDLGFYPGVVGDVGVASADAG